MNTKSIENLTKVASKLKDLVFMINQEFPIEVICGYRGEEEQNYAFNSGKSKLKYPDSKHNKSPSQAVDIVPRGTYFSDINAFYVIYGIALVKAKELGIIIRWGGNWNSDFNFKDNRFNDLVHYEIVT